MAIMPTRSFPLEAISGERFWPNPKEVRAINNPAHKAARDIKCITPPHHVRTNFSDGTQTYTLDGDWLVRKVHRSPEQSYRVDPK